MNPHKSIEGRNRIRLLKILLDNSIRICKIGATLVTSSLGVGFYFFYEKYPSSAILVNPIFFIPLISGVGFLLFGAGLNFWFTKQGRKWLEPFEKAKTMIVPQLKQSSVLENYIKGMAKLEKGSISGIIEAIKCFDAAIGVDPTSKYAYYGKAKAIMELVRKTEEKENLKQAEKSVERALELDPKFDDANKLMGELRKLKRR